MEEPKLLLTYSAMQTYKKCPRQYYWRYEQGIVSVEDAKALRIGKAFHKGREVYIATGDIDQAVTAMVEYEGDAYEQATLAALLAAHAWYWSDREGAVELADSKYQWGSPEREFILPLINPDTGRPSLTYMLAGKVDGDPTRGNTELLYELKTTGDSIDSASDYWARLRMDGQVSMYVSEAMQRGRQIAAVLYDVVRKPSMRPAMATPIESRKYTKDGLLYKSQRDTDETPQEWSDRLFEDIQSRPEFYFQRREIIRLNDDILEFQRETWQLAKQINWARTNASWPRTVTDNTCTHCPFKGPCLDGRDLSNPLPEGLRRVNNPHLELESIGITA